MSLFPAQLVVTKNAYLVFDDVVFQLGESQSRICCGPGRSGMLGKELVNNLRKELMCDQGRIGVITDNDASNALAASICVECALYRFHMGQQL